MEGWQEVVCLWNLVGGGWREGVWAYVGTCTDIHVHITCTEVHVLYLSHVQMCMSHVNAYGMYISHVWMYTSHIPECTCTCSYCMNVLYVHICVDSLPFSQFIPKM